MHEGHRKRMKEKFLKSGLSGFAEHEALEFLLFFAIKRVNTNDIAHRLIERFGSFSAVLEADERDLVEVEGVGPETALFLKSIPQFSDYYARHRWENQKNIENAMQAGFFCADLIGNLLYETFYVICLDNNRKILAKIKLADGAIDHVNIDMRKLAFEILKFPTKSVIFTHNHPSGILTPSCDDIDLTMRLCDFLQEMEIDVVDHIIVCGNQSVSMAQQGLMDSQVLPRSKKEGLFR